MNKQRLILGLAFFALVPVAREVDSLVALSMVTGLLWAMIAYEAVRFSDARAQVRHEERAEPPS